MNEYSVIVVAAIELQNENDRLRKENEQLQAKVINFKGVADEKF